MAATGERLESRPVLITGGAGFLGRHLAARLDASGCRVTVLDDLSCANSTFDCAGLASTRIRKIHGSVFDRALVARLVATHPVVVHFASVVGVEETVSHTIPTIENLSGTIGVVRALTPDHVVLFGSSADVYGVHSRLYDQPMREDDLVVYENGRVNRWVYPHVKALEENLFSNSAARSAVVRIFNCYGAEMDYPAPKRVIPHFIDCILHRRPLLLSGDGAQRRSFCYVDDMVDGLVAVLKHAAGGEGPRSQCFNLGHPEPICIRDLAHAMVDCALDIGLIDKPLPIVADRFVYSQGFDDRWHRTPDIGHAARTLGFSPRVALRDGLGRTLDYYRQLRSTHADLAAGIARPAITAALRKTTSIPAPG
ncbi:MAG TPA: NAD-dependent epimerase/dehydratase family protein [Casimicrobiaceae bacterium]|nr:NAD-dependent epimerase/dehydratase family protein [Casimicrobiaceae bacterium]